MSPRPTLYTICLTCEEPFERDEPYTRESGIGAWHRDCGPPRNLALYRRERDRGKPQRTSPYSTDSVVRA